MRVLSWRHRGWLSWSFDLMEGQQRLASLQQRAWSMNAVLSVEGREEDLKLRGLFRWSIALLDRAGHERATMAIGWRGQGEAILEDGRRFRWAPASFWGTRWTLEGPDGRPLATVHMDRFLKMDARVEVEDDPGLDEATLLRVLAITWYSAVITMQSATSAGTIAAIS